MADLKPEAIEPDPAATSIPNDKSVVKEAVDTSAPTDITAEKAEVKQEGANGATNVESVDKPAGNGNKNGERPERRRERENERDSRSNHKRGGYNNSNHRGGNNHRQNRNQWKKNNKFDPTSKEVSDVPVAIRAQVEFYFGDSNLPQDKFLWEQTDGSDNKPIPVTTIHSFKRMQVFQPYSAVVEALKASSFLVVEGEEGKEVVKRKEAYDPKQPKDAREPRTVYVKGFGEERPSSQFDIEAFFANYGTTRAVRLRRHFDGPDQGLFKGSVFVEFEDEETAKKFVELDPAPQWEGQDLKILTKSAYKDEKVELIKAGKMQPNAIRPPKFDADVEAMRRDRDPNDWKRRREDDQRSGFRNDRKGGRGDRGGRGGRGGRGSRDRRDNRDRDSHREEKKEVAADPAAAAVAAEDSKKRARDADDTGSSEAPAEKKQDVKTEGSAES